jgi:kynurenine formamidase
MTRMASYAITMSEHTSSHIDSPYHVFPSGWKLSQIPNNRIYNVPGVMIDLSAKINSPGRPKPNYAVLKEDIME